MYNIYIEEKKQKQHQKEEEEKFRKLQIAKKHKSNLRKLVTNYQERVKQFIYDMAQDKNRIQVNDYANPIINSRIKYIDENDKKIKGRKGFLFGSFVNERERIKKAIEDNSWMMSNSLEFTRLTHYPKQNPSNSCGSETQGASPRKETLNPIKKRNNKLNHSQSTPMIDTGCYQPHMRFKPRTDLERIYESINLNFHGRADKDVITRQLKNLDLYSSKKKYSTPIVSKCSITPMDEDKKSGLDFPDYLCQDFITPKHNNSKLSDIFKRKSSPNIKIYYKKSLNAESKQLISGFHIKTHFRALESIPLLPNQINISKSLSTNNKYYPPLLKPKKYIIKNQDHNQNVLFDLTEEDKLVQKIEDKRNDCLKNRNTFYNSRNPAKIRRHSSSNIECDHEKINTLKKLAFEKEDLVMLEKEKAAHKREELNDEFKKEEYKLLIGNDVYYTNHQIDLIANTLLNKCNVYHKKNKNNRNKLKAGDGKLMMTKGLSINEFVTKHNLNY